MAVIVGERKDSQTYVRMKRKACDEVRFTRFTLELPETIKELIDVVKGTTTTQTVTGFNQLPLPKHIDEEKVLGVISGEGRGRVSSVEYRDVAFVTLNRCLCRARRKDLSFC